MEKITGPIIKNGIQEIEEIELKEGKKKNGRKKKKKTSNSSI